MLFNSFTFFWFFLAVLVVYWCIAASSVPLRNLFLVAVSYLFYGWWDARFLILIAASSAIDFVVALAIERCHRGIQRRIWLCVSILANLGCLGFFKYYGFFLDSLAIGLSQFGIAPSWPTWNVILPLGISFYTLQTLGYTIDVYRGQISATRDATAFFAYVSFFPQLVAGPIERASLLLPQFETLHAFNDESARDGLRQFLWGLFKKVVIADQCASLADPIFATYSEQSASTILLASFYFGIQIYGDFSGYSDMAIGLARLLGFSLMKNFDRPYFSTSISEFWQRWHISLSTWFRDYVYIPLGGNRCGTARTFANLWVVFTISGLWHGAAWNYVLWGWLHFLYLVPGAIVRSPILLSSLPTPLAAVVRGIRMLVVGLLVCFAWILFRVHGTGDAIHCAFAVFDSSLFSKPDCSRIGLIWVAILFTAEWLQGTRAHPLAIGHLPIAVRWSIYIVLIILCLGCFQSNSPFLYFQF